MIEVAAKEYERILNWDDAMLYCSLLVIDNKDDWRLPTLAELNYIYYKTENDLSYAYWSSTEHNGVYAWVHDISDGYQGYFYKDVSGAVRAVRSLNI